MGAPLTSRQAGGAAGASADSLLCDSCAALESEGRLVFEEQGRVCVGDCEFEASGNAAASYRILKKKRTRSTGLKNRQVATVMEGDGLIPSSTDEYAHALCMVTSET